MSEIKTALPLPQRLYTVEKWVVVSYGICSNCVPFDPRRRYVLCSACKYLTLLMKIALLLSSWKTDTKCRLGTTEKQQGEHHIPRQNLLIMWFLKEKRAHTHLCARVPYSEIFRRVSRFQARVLHLHNSCKIRSWKQNQPKTSNNLQNNLSSHYKPSLLLHWG